MAANSPADLYAVFGNPIAHSKSPQIHHAFAAACGQHIDYQRRLAEVDGFAAALQQFAAEGGRGANVTVPFKQEALTCCQALSKRAQRAQAVNTLIPRPEGGWLGDNTDGLGLLRDLSHNLGAEIERRRLLILGAGGAVRGVLAPLIEARPATLSIANRTLSKAEDLARDFADLMPIQCQAFADLTGPFDLIINATSAGLSGQMPDLCTDILATDCLCYDMVYADEPTAFLRWANAQGVSRCHDGLGMLVEQAAEAYQRWHGLRPDTVPVIQQLRPAR